MILSILLSSIFFILGALHLYWVLGGKFGLAESLPTKESGERALNPGKIETAIVGLGLISFGLFYLLKSGVITYDLPEWIMEYGAWIIPAVFILRAIGDFKYIGFFKTIKHTDFGKLDTKFFSPLCVIMGLTGIIIQVIR